MFVPQAYLSHLAFAKIHKDACANVLQRKNGTDISSVTASARHASKQGVKDGKGGGGGSSGRTHLRNDHDLQAAIGSDNGDSAIAQGHRPQGSKHAGTSK